MATPETTDPLQVHVRKSCACRSGFTCGDRSKCGLKMMECINTHFFHECEHDFTGPEIEFDEGRGTTTTCTKCGMDAMSHDMRAGP